MSLVYTCAPAASGAATARRNKAKGRTVRLRHPTVDIHCHVFTPEAATLVKDLVRPQNDPYSFFHSAASKQTDARQAAALVPKLTSIAERLKVMDTEGIDIQAISTAPIQYYYWADGTLALRTAQLINNNIAQICAVHPDRFVGLATVPMQVTDYAVRELTRAVRELGLKGVEICPHVEQEELSAERFRPFFAKAEELGALIFMHPHGFPDGRRLADHFFQNIIGNPLDTTVAIHHLIFGGVLDAYPRLKIVCAHGGGYLPAYAGRIDHAHAARPDARTKISQKPSSYLKKLYFDTIVFTHQQLAYLAKQYGTDHLLLGTDYPYDMALPDAVQFVEKTPGLTERDKALILGGNAARLLGVKLPKAPPSPR
ncbi:MAG: amidohydrolase [Alphaproteobacteria bacterium]|nr:amidohydrolase [Alphaproteobacteria bacterium]